MVSWEKYSEKKLQICQNKFGRLKISSNFVQ